MVFLAYVAVAIIFALILAIPDIAARAKYPQRWVPVNFPPTSIGDDYHYYSILNLFHRFCLQKLTGIKQLLIPFHAPSNHLLFSLIINVLPFHIGYRIEDRRIGILFVRFWNHFLFFFAALATTHWLLRLLAVDAIASVSTLTVLMYYLSLDDFVPNPTGTSVLCNLLSSEHIYRKSASNEISRAFNLATSGALFMLSIAWLLVPAEVLPSGSTLHWATSLALNLLLYYSYFPLACVFGFVSITKYILSDHYVVFSLVSLLANGVFSYIFIRDFLRDTTARETMRPTGGGRLLAIGKRRLLVATAVIGTPLVVYYLTPSVGRDYIIVFGATSLCVLFTFQAQHQGSRFWARGAVLLYQLLLMAWVVSQAVQWGLLTPMTTAAAIIILGVALVVYEVRNGKQLIESGEKLAPAWIADLGFIAGTHLRGKTIATDSLPIGYYTFLYTDNYCLLKNYSIQSSGYRENLREFCSSLRIAGRSLDDVLNLFSQNVNPNEWVDMRLEFDRNISAKHKSTIYNFQFMATYHDYNQSLRDEGLYDSSGWTSKMKELVQKIWTTLDDSSNEKYQVILDPTMELKSALGEMKAVEHCA